MCDFVMYGIIPSAYFSLTLCDIKVGVSDSDFWDLLDLFCLLKMFSVIFFKCEEVMNSFVQHKWLKN